MQSPKILWPTTARVEHCRDQVRDHDVAPPAGSLWHKDAYNIRGFGTQNTPIGGYFAYNGIVWDKRYGASITLDQ